MDSRNDCTAYVTRTGNVMQPVTAGKDRETTARTGIKITKRSGQSDSPERRANGEVAEQVYALF